MIQANQTTTAIELIEMNRNWSNYAFAFAFRHSFNQPQSAPFAISCSFNNHLSWLGLLFISFHHYSFWTSIHSWFRFIQSFFLHSCLICLLCFIACFIKLKTWISFPEWSENWNSVCLIESASNWSCHVILIFILVYWVNEMPSGNLSFLC